MLEQIAFPFEKRGWYPHMKPADVAIWERFIDKNPGAYDTAEYDVEVGSPPPFDTVVNPETGGSVESLYKRKIDVVGTKNGNKDIIEIKPRAGTSAIGQVTAYARLYVRDFRPNAPTRPVIITDEIGVDMPELAEAAGVILIAA